MSLLYPHHIILFSVNAITSFLLAVLIWKRRHVPGGWILFLLMIAAGGWASSSALEFASMDITWKLFWSKMSYLFIPYAAPLWFLAIMRYLQRDRWFVWRRMMLVGLIPTAMMVLAFMNDQLMFLWSSVTPIADTPGAMLVYGHGPGFWINVLYSYVLMFTGAAYLLSAIMRFQNLYRRQAGALIVLILLPWASNMFYVFDVFGMPGLDITPLAFTASGAILAFSIYRYSFLDLVPVARHTLFENMRNGVVVLDAGNRLIDFNPSARLLLGLDRSRIGKPAGETGPALASILAVLAGNGSLSSEHTIEMPASGRSLHVSASFFEHHGLPAGRVLVVQDITEQRRLERERKEIGASLEKALSDIKTLQHLIPICSYCKKIRTDEGFWLQIENFLAEHSELVFSHGICPDCKEKYYGWLDSIGPRSLPEDQADIIPPPLRSNGADMDEASA